LKGVNKPVVALVASTSGTGKTTLLEGLIGKLKSRGYRVGVVKHSIHEAALDREGSDSWRFQKAGADVTVLAAKGQLAVMRTGKDPSPHDALLEASSHADIVLVEGFREIPIPKIEVYRSGHSGELFCRGRGIPDPLLAAVASDVPLDLDVPVLDLNNHEEICGFIVDRFLKNGCDPGMEK
jgi:molybdopterin-guanine dinucleotide biosynthesis protein MobB